MTSHTEPVEIVRQALSGQCRINERTHTSTLILAERLDRVKQLGGLFEQIAFSPHMEALLSCRQPAGAAGLAAV